MSYNGHIQMNQRSLRETITFIIQKLTLKATNKRSSVTKAKLPIF